MKTKTTLLTLILVALTVTATQAKEWSVGGPLPTTAATEAGDKVFFTLQGAHDDDDVRDGDVFYVIGNQQNYGALTLTKELTIYGPGYFLAENDGLQVNDNSAKTNGITFNPGSEGSVLAGMVVEGRVVVNTSNITISRNFISLSSTSVPGVRTDNGVSNISVSQNYLVNRNGGSNRTINGILVGEENDLIIIRNNSINAVNSGFAAIFSPLNSTNIEISHNVLRGRITANNAKFFNNIIRSADVTAINGEISNNICNAAQLPESQDNQLNVDMATVFVDSVPGDAWAQLRPGSPAKRAGLGEIDGEKVDIGMFGGADPYRLSGIPPIPTVYSLEETSQSDTSITFEVKARSNN